ncbi:MAG: hypothetical protein Q9208_008383 [Pyrenodesmia sp. 3 TL-2023]
MARALARKRFERARSGHQPNELSLPQLEDGHMKLYNHHTPVLPEGTYGIEAKQIIETANEELHVYNYDSLNPAPSPAGEDYPVAPQKFTVVAPRFQIDPRAINSYYPPDGFVEEGRILPYIVFNDPHLPWERSLFQPRIFPPADVIDPFFRLKTRPPWIALVVFDPEELQLTKADGDALRVPAFNANELPGSGAYPMTVGDYLTKVTSRVPLEEGLPPHSIEWANLQASPDPVKIIFPNKDLVQTIFPHENLMESMFMAHVRQVSTIDMPDAAGDDSRLYSICMSHRSGPTIGAGSSKPTTQIVHLVSVENIIYGPYDPANASNRIGVISLFSWTYTSTPPLPSNFTAIMKNLADQKQMLRPPNPILNEIVTSVNGHPSSEIKAGSKLLQERLSLGYTISQWRTSTGEETAAFMRGPLVPIPTLPTPTAMTPSDWPATSNTGKDYQILDRDSGLMDLTYSAAWQLGKTMAMLDAVFFQALLRFRSAIRKTATSEVRMALSGLEAAADVINRAPRTMMNLGALTEGGKAPMRNVLVKTSSWDGAFNHPNMLPLSRSLSGNAIDRSVQFGDQIFSDSQPGNANNADWELIHKWISDKLFLSGIPAHYLVTDPSHLASTPAPFSPKGPIQLPPEALRFFHIDDAWLDCLIDGALSVANHYSAETDIGRLKIKEVYNTYLRTPVEGTTLKPPAPRYGFFLRSALVRAIPDLRVIITCKKVENNVATEDPDRTPLIRLTKMDDHTILALLDCLPEQIYKILLVQPPHQQRFTAPIAADGVPYTLKRLYTRGAAANWYSFHVPPSEIAKWYDPATRVVKMPKFVESLKSLLPFRTTAPPAFDADIGSAVVALELNDRNYQLEIKPPSGSSPPVTIRGDRQLWTGSTTTPAAPQPVALRARDSFQGTSPIDLVESIRKDLMMIKEKAQPSIPTTVPNKSTQISHHPSPTISTLPSLSALSTPQYTLSIRPAYRSASPLPTISSTTPPHPVYSPSDYLPTQSPYLIDLIISLNRRADAPTETGMPLLALTVIISTNTTLASSSDPNADEEHAVEPLLQAYRGPGATMLHNHRLLPLLSRSANQLQIHLISRSAAPPPPSPPNPIKAKLVTNVAVLLKGCTIAGVERVREVEVAGEGVVRRGVADVGWVERYAVGGENVDVKGVVGVVKRDVDV